MKHKEKFRFVGFLVLVMFASTLFIPLADAATYRFSEAQITTNISTAEENPDLYISGNNYRIVWQDNRNGNWDIYLFDSSSISETRITTDTANQMNPKIYGDIIVWQDYRNGKLNIYMYNVSSKIETQVTNSIAYQDLPAIDGEHIVWEDYRNGKWDVYLYDLISQTEQLLTQGVGNDNYPVISGDIVAYRNETRDFFGYIHSYICYYNLSSNQQVTLTARSDGKTNCIVDLGIDGTRVVWTERHQLSLLYGTWTWHVHMMDIVTGIHWQTWGADEERPDIYGNYIVYENEIGYKRNNIFLFDLETSQEYKMTDFASSVQYSPVVFSGWMNGLFCVKVVYMDNRNSNWDLFEASRWTIPEPIAVPPKPRPYPSPDEAVKEARALQNRVADTSLIFVSDFEGANMKVKGNRRNAMLNQLESIVTSVQAAADADDSQTQQTCYQDALDQLNMLITKTDGVVLRGKADKPGSGYTPDWLANSMAQAAIYPQIKECLTILQMLTN